MPKIFLTQEYRDKDPHEAVCPFCGCDEVEMLDWVKHNTCEYVGGNESVGDGDRWCPVCETHPIFMDRIEFIELVDSLDHEPESGDELFQLWLILTGESNDNDRDQVTWAYLEGVADP